VNVQVIADPAGRLVGISPALPGARHDMGAAREHGIIDAFAAAGVRAAADSAYEGGGPAIRVSQRRRAASEPVKPDETVDHSALMSASRLGSLIHAAVGSSGGAGRRWLNRAGFAA
jgi:hypothetical protein